MVQVFVNETSLWRGARRQSGWLIPNGTVAPQIRVSNGTHKSVALNCLPPSRVFNTPSMISEQKGEMFKPNAAMIEAEPSMQAMPRGYQILYLQKLIAELKQAPTTRHKMQIILDQPAVQQFFETPAGIELASLVGGLEPQLAFCILCLPAIQQEHVLKFLPPNGALWEPLERLALDLARIEEFYDSIGGLAGYQLQCLQLIEEHRCGGSTSSVEDAPGPNDIEFLVPVGLDLTGHEAATTTALGLKSLPLMAEIYPLGGAGDRLGLCCENTGDSLPTAVLPYLGRTLLEALMRDLQGREYLYYKVYGKQHVTPVAVMTSAVKGNHWRVKELFQSLGWFGRGEDSFRLFSQPLVPVVAAQDGKWLMCNTFKPVMKPGGHGVIWKLMLDSGIFDWLSDSNRRAAIVRQISNPMAGQDTTLLALAGEGIRGQHAFGFASCERVVGAAEGMNVILKQSVGDGKFSYRLTNVEYTEFERLGIEDKGATEGSEHSAFPANTNVLYLGLDQIEAKVRQGVEAGTTEAVLPGMILNLKKEVCHRDLETGLEVKTRGGRLECTMQNLADTFNTVLESDQDFQHNPLSLDAFMVYGPRQKVTSSAKRQRSPGSTKIHQTPDGSLYDLLRNASDMMTGAGMSMPPLGSVSEYLERGPGFLFFFHPALGPLWDVVAQKIRGGALAPRSEITLEVAEADIENLHVDGSFLVIADAIMGHLDHYTTHGTTSAGGKLTFSDRCGRVTLRNVTIHNAGIDWSSPSNIYWRHRVTRKEDCRILLHGNAEFEAYDVELRGQQRFEVPDGYKMRAYFNTHLGEVCTELTPLETLVPSWRWEYALSENTEKIILRRNDDNTIV